MLSRAMISGILNLISNTGLGTQSGGTTGTSTHAGAAQATAITQGTSADLAPVKTVAASTNATAPATAGETTQSGGGANGRAGEAAAFAGAAGLDADAAARGKSSVDLAQNAPQNPAMQAVDDQLRSLMARRAFAQNAASQAQTAPQEADAGESSPDRKPAPPPTAVAGAAPSLVMQERMIRADLAAELKQIAQTRDIGPADALRIMAGHNPQFPLEDPTA